MVKCIFMSLPLRRIGLRQESDSHPFRLSFYRFSFFSSFFTSFFAKKKVIIVNLYPWHPFQKVTPLSNLYTCHYMQWNVPPTGFEIAIFGSDCVQTRCPWLVLAPSFKTTLPNEIGHSAQKRALLGHSKCAGTCSLRKPTPYPLDHESFALKP